MMEEYENRPDIPGLVETEKNRKGKKKGGANKKTLSLQTFLQDESQETNLDSAEQADTDPLESHFAKLNLDDEELIVMESCHSYFHDILRQMGPTNAMDARLQNEMDSFPPEAKVVTTGNWSRTDLQTFRKLSRSAEDTEILFSDRRTWRWWTRL